jgi:hypothetical protein
VKFMSLMILLLFTVSVFAEDTGKQSTDEIQYENVEHMTFKKSVLSSGANGEGWTADPVLVSLKFIGPSEGKTQTIERTYSSTESPDTATVVITNEKLLDDSVMGVRYKLVLSKNETAAWIIGRAGKAVKCWEGRGHMDYSKEACK